MQITKVCQSSLFRAENVNTFWVTDIHDSTFAQEEFVYKVQTWHLQKYMHSKQTSVMELVGILRTYWEQIKLLIDSPWILKVTEEHFTFMFLRNT